MTTRILLLLACFLPACSQDDGSGEDEGAVSAAACTIEARSNPRDQGYLEPAADNPDSCPADPSGECTESGETCSYLAACQSQDRPISFKCVLGRLQPHDECMLADDECTVIKTHCNRGCGEDSAPTCCPWDRPAEGVGCVVPWGAYSCGYWCDDGVTWTVATCDLVVLPDGTTDGTAAWTYDDACRGGCER